MYYGLDSTDIPYKGLVISISYTSEFVKIYDYDPVSDCYCVLLKDGYMTIDEAKAWVDEVMGA